MNSEELKKLWKTGEHVGSFSGANTFNRSLEHGRRNLIKQEVFPHLLTYQKFRVAKRPKVYNPYFVYQLRTIIQSDLIFMDQPKDMINENNGFKYILIVQDIFSRKIWTQALKTKKALEVKEKLNDILEQMSPFRKEARFIIDRGTEYLNESVKKVLRKFSLSITHPSDGHAAHVERANLSLQRILFQYMNEQSTRKWVDFLDRAVKNMNNRYHRIIKMSPEEAENPDMQNKVNEAMAIYQQKAFGEKRKRNKKTFKVGDMVRIQRYKNVFNRGYQPTFTDEVFKISKVLDHLPITMYALTEWDGGKIEGNFYPEELTLVKGNIFKVEKIIKKMKKKGVPSAFVKWEGFDKKYNSWIPLTDLVES